MFHRWAESRWQEKFVAPYVHIVFGARQTGKSTLIQNLLPAHAARIDLSIPKTRAQYLTRPDDLIALCRGLRQREGGAWVFVDEAQNVPALFDAVQHLYDGDKQRWRFILCGSSARKLRQTGANLLPGRSFLHRLFPLTLAERPPGEGPIEFDAPLVLPLDWPDGKRPAKPCPRADLLTRLTFGELPGVVTADESHRAEMLHAYTQLHPCGKCARPNSIWPTPWCCAWASRTTNPPAPSGTTPLILS